MRDTVLGRSVAFGVGFLTFLAAHALEAMQWASWFGGEHEAWFLNSGRAVLVTLASVSVASGLVALFSSSRPGPLGFTVALGACVGMTVVLFSKPGGPGTIFPIVMAVGGGGLVIGSALGAWAGRAVRDAARSQ